MNSSRFLRIYSSSVLKYFVISKMNGMLTEKKKKKGKKVYYDKGDLEYIYFYFLKSRPFPVLC